MRRVVIMGAAGRDFHVHNTVFRDDPAVEVVAFTAAQIPGVADRRYPSVLAGARYPSGIPIVDESRLEEVVTAGRVDEVVFAYSDLSHVEVMHRASRALAAGADFRIVGPRASMLRSRLPVVAVCATRTGAGKSQTSRVVARLLRDRGLRVGWMRHPMPYGDLAAMVTQRFASRADLDAADVTLEEREEYELPVDEGFTVWAGVDYEALLRRAEAASDVILWDGGNDDLPFVAPDLLLTVTDALRPGDETTYHPGEACLRLADAVVVNKVDHARPADVESIRARIDEVCGDVPVVLAGSRVQLDEGPPIGGARVLVVEDGPSLTHGGLATGAGLAAARAAGATVIDPRPHAVGTVADALGRWPQLGPVLPALGYSAAQRADLAASIDAVDCDIVIAGTPIDLAAAVPVRHPVRRVRYELAEIGSPTVAEVLAPFLASVSG